MLRSVQSSYDFDGVGTGIYVNKRPSLKKSESKEMFLVDQKSSTVHFRETNFTNDMLVEKMSDSVMDDKKSNQTRLSKAGISALDESKLQ